MITGLKRLTPALGLLWALSGSVYASDLLQESQQLIASEVTFNTEYKGFETEQADIARMQQLEGKNVVVLYGTWCPDSQREVPRFIKLVEKSGVKLADIKLVAVDRQKQHPEGLHEKYALERTPTFIVLDGDKELLRVVEKPEHSLAEALTKGL